MSLTIIEVTSPAAIIEVPGQPDPPHIIEVSASKGPQGDKGDAGTANVTAPLAFDVITGTISVTVGTTAGDVAAGDAPSAAESAAKTYADGLISGEASRADGAYASAQTVADAISGLGSASTHDATDFDPAGAGAAAAAALVDAAPQTLDTLNELAAALGDDPNFAASTAQLIGTKADTADLGSAAFAATADFDAAGTAATAVSNHAGATDPHGDRSYAAGLVNGLGSAAAHPATDFATPGSVSSAITALGLGTAATKNTGTGAGDVATGSHTHAGMLTSATVTGIEVITQSAYNALSPPVSTVLYWIQG